MAYHSVPMKSKQCEWTGAGSGSRAEGVDESVAHLKDMLEEVKLMHLHPTAAFGGETGHSTPDCLVYQVSRRAPCQ